MYPTAEVGIALLTQRTHRLAILWTIEREDGELLFLTNHDHDIVRISGNVFSAAAGANVSATMQRSGLSEGDFDIQGAISSNFITAEDLKAGLYDRAKVTQRFVDWRYPEHNLFRQIFFIDRVEFTELGYVARVQSPARILKKKVGWQTTRHCANELGDGRCTVNLSLAVNRTEEVIAGVTDRRQFTLDVALFGSGGFGGTANAGRLNQGILTWKAGAANFGVPATIQAVLFNPSFVTLLLYEPMPFEVQVGDGMVLQGGCDKVFTGDCIQTYNNGINFNGAPHVPGSVDITPSKS